MIHNDNKLFGEGEKKARSKLLRNPKKIPKERQILQPLHAQKTFQEDVIKKTYPQNLNNKVAQTDRQVVALVSPA